MWDWVNDGIKILEKKMLNSASQKMLEPIDGWLKETVSNGWVWFIDVLPDMAAYGTYLTGAVVMLSPLVIRGGMIKPLSYLAAGLIVTVCILTTN